METTTPRGADRCPWLSPSKTKIGFIDGSIPKPTSEDVRMVNIWKRNNNIVVSWILNSVSKEIASSIQFEDSAEIVWKDLQEHFQQNNGPRIFQIFRNLVNLSQDQRSVGAHFHQNQVYMGRISYLIFYVRRIQLWRGEGIGNLQRQCVCDDILDGP